MMLEYLGDSSPPEQCDGCDSCRDLPRPWRGEGGITRDALLEAIPARRTTLRLVTDTNHRNLSETNLIRTLTGEAGGRYPLHANERGHPCFGRLEMMGSQAVKELIDTLITERLISREERKLNGLTYTTLTTTEKGDKELSRMG